MLRSFVSDFYPDLGFSGWMDGGMALYMVTYLNGRFRTFTIFGYVLTDRSAGGAYPEDLAERAAGRGIKPGSGDIGLFLYGYSFLHYLSDSYGANRACGITSVSESYHPNTILRRISLSRCMGRTYGPLAARMARCVCVRPIRLKFKTFKARPMTHSQAIDG